MYMTEVSSYTVNDFCRYTEVIKLLYALLILTEP